MNLYYYKHSTQTIKHAHSLALLEHLSHQNNWGAVSYNEAGKPLIERGYVSISHSKHHLICAYADYEIGVDMEVSRPLSLNLIKRFNLDTHEPLIDWCLREAYFKLSADFTHVFKAIPNDISTHIFSHDECHVVVVSHHVIDRVDVIDLTNQIELNF